MRGTIRSLQKEKGFGFITVPSDASARNDEYFFHCSAVAGRDFLDLKIGDTVEFEPTHGPKGLRAENIIAS